MRAGLVRLPTSPLVHNRSRHRPGLRRTSRRSRHSLVAVASNQPRKLFPRKSFGVRGQRSLSNALLTNLFGYVLPRRDILFEKSVFAASRGLASPLNKPISKPVKADANMNRSFFSTISGLLSILSVAQAQPAATPTPDRPSRIISVYGTATVHVAPNLATITIAVVTQNKDALQAQQENAKRSTAVINAVKGVTDPAMEVSTGEYSIVVQHPIEGNVRTTEIAGYQVTNSISVKMRDLSKVGEVLDQSTLAGANSVGNVSFGLENNEASRREALSAATADAVARVQAIVRGLNANDAAPVRFRTIDISEAGLEYTPWRATEQQMRTFALPAASTPVEAGKMDVTATVCLRAELL